MRGLIRLYQKIRLKNLFPSIGLPMPNCRFYPSCSRYAEEAFGRYGFWKGGRFTLGRLFRCHPFHGGGWDPVEFHEA